MLTQLHLKLDVTNSHEFSSDLGGVQAKNKFNGSFHSNSVNLSTDCSQGLRRNFKLLGLFHHRKVERVSRLLNYSNLERNMTFRE